MYQVSAESDARWGDRTVEHYQKLVAGNFDETQGLGTRRTLPEQLHRLI